MITYILIWIAIGYVSGIAAFIADYREGVKFSIGDIIVMCFACLLGPILTLIILSMILDDMDVFDKMKEFLTKPRIGKNIKNEELEDE